eukprot:CFRG7188T1
MLPSYSFGGVTFSAVLADTFDASPLLPVVERVGSDDEDPQGFYSKCATEKYDMDRANTLGTYFLRLGGLGATSGTEAHVPSLLITYEGATSTEATGMIYDIDGGADREEEFLVSAFNNNKQLIASDLSPRGVTNDCELNPYESNPWEFRLLPTGGESIKYIRIDYVGTGSPEKIGLGFDNFRQYGCNGEPVVPSTSTSPSASPLAVSPSMSSLASPSWSRAPVIVASPSSSSAPVIVPTASSSPTAVVPVGSPSAAVSPSTSSLASPSSSDAPAASPSTTAILPVGSPSAKGLWSP